MITIRKAGGFRPAFILCMVLALLAMAVRLPPFLTGGACTQEFDAAGALLHDARPERLTLSALSRGSCFAATTGTYPQAG